MASKENAELDPLNTGTGDETIVAERKKRLRRVSFADVEITSIHIFKRDEDYSDSTPPSDPNPCEETGKQPGGDGLMLFRDLGDRHDDFEEHSRDRVEDEGEEENGEASVGRASFFRPIESPSPGSSTVGSAITNDEDNFFGPVQAGFIRPGRLSDSAASDENHDITMDSTAFSMHYRSLARSESDLKTPTRVGLGFEEKTSSQDAKGTNQGSSMVLTNARKLTPESSLPRDNSRSGGKDSNEMSLVGENPYRYDYGRISPSLDALLAEGGEDLHRTSPSHFADLKPSSIFDENASGPNDLISFGDEEIGWSTHDTIKVSAADIVVQEANSYCNITPMKHVMEAVSNKHDWSANLSDNKTINTPEQQINGKQLIENKAEVDGLNVGLSKGTPRSNGNRLIDLDITALHVSKYGGSSENYLKEYFPGNESESLVKSDRVAGSPLAGSISSISAKRREIFSHAAISPANFLNLTPLPALSAASSTKGSAKRGLNLSSIQKSISKFRSLETSPTSSALKTGIESLKLKISNYISANSPHNAAHFESSTGVLSKGVHPPAAHLEQLNEDREAIGYKSMHIVDCNDIPKLQNIETDCSLGQNRETAFALKPGETQSPLYVSNNGLARDVLGMTSSPDNLSWSGPISADISKGYACETSSPLMNIVLDHTEDDAKVRIPLELLVSPVKEVNQNSSAAKNYQRGVSAELNRLYQSKDLIGVTSEVNQTSQGKVASVEYLTPNTKRLQSFSVTEGTIQKSPTLKYFQGSSSLELNQNHQLNKFAGVISEEKQTPLEIVASGGSPNPEKLQSLSSGTVVRVGENLNLVTMSTSTELPSVNNGAGFRKEVPSLVSDVSLVLTSVDSHGKRDGSPFKKSPLKNPAESNGRVRSTQSPLVRELSNSLPAGIVQFLPREERAYSPSKLNRIGMVEFQKSNHSEGLIPAGDCKESPSKKRKSEEVVLRDEHHITKVPRTDRSLEVGRSDRHDFSGGGPSNEIENPGPDRPQRDLKDVLTKFSQDMAKMLSPFDQLDLRGISMLEAMLDYLQKVRNYDVLRSEVQSELSNAPHKRSAAPLLLLQKLVYEKARLHLNMVRRDRLQKMAQNLSSGIKKSQELRRIYGESVFRPVERDNQVDGACHLCSANSKLQKGANETVVSLRQECEAVDAKIRSLSNSLLAYCKTKGERSCTSDVVSLDDCLKRRMYCRLVHQNLQPWKIGNVESTNGHRTMSLDYLGFIHQSFSVTTYPNPSLTVSNKLQAMKILKTFPNMDACTAFAYVFGGEITKKMVSSRSLAQKTQETNSLLQNLLELLEEVQQARLEIKNLASTSFHSPREGPLRLLLSFIDLNRDQKVMITLDMACLNRGIYPSEALPDHVEVVTNGMLQSLTMEIRAAVRSLPFGHQRVMRLCSCISKLLQTRSG